MKPKDRIHCSRVESTRLRHFPLHRYISTCVAAWLSFGLLAVSQAQPAGIILGPTSPSLPGVELGELLLGELNCVACHEASATVQKRLSARRSPSLSDAGTRMTPQYLRAFLSNPGEHKLGTTMPDMMHGRSASEHAESVEALTHFLSSLSTPKALISVDADQFKIQEGRRLYHQVGCVACHAPQEPASAVQAKSSSGEAPTQASQSAAVVLGFDSPSVPLGNLAQKTTVDQLARFLLDPLQVRPSGRMPSFNLVESEATAIAMYLLREQAPGMMNPSSNSLQRIQGLQYEYFEEDAFGENAPKFEALKPKATGFVDHFSIDSHKRNHNFGYRFTGTIRIPADGDYTFYTESDDGSRLYLGEKLVVQNDGQHPMAEGQGKITLQAGEHPIAVTYFNGGGEWGLKVSYDGPEISKREIPAQVLSHFGQPMAPIGNVKFVLDPVKAARGRELFSSLGCAACHQVDNISPVRALSSKALADLNVDNPEGCLGNRVKGGVPQYHLAASQLQALRTTVAAQEQLSQPLSAREQVTRTMTALNCYACHSRDGAGGPTAERAHYFAVIGEADLGDEGRLPPHLTGVGDKLQPEWVREVLLNKGTARPYMATRMPQFGEANIEGLITALVETDSSRRPDRAMEYSARDAKFGRKLVGRDGLTCIACHTFAQYKSLGIPAMDLTMMTKRLKKDWFHRYVIDPPSLRPGTRMPSFWPEGKAVNTEILEGDANRQIDAIWMYLSQGREADVPAGLIHAKMELIAENEAIIYRNFIEGAGARAIGVGYPEKANLAFDANDLRLALIWQGPFIDASRHRSDRGVGFEPPLGDHVLKMTPGAPFAVLPDLRVPWPEIVGKKAGYKMQGYRLDEKRRPVFLYSFQSVRVEDYPVAVPGELDAGFKRTLTLRAEEPPENLWFRAAAGSNIRSTEDGSYLVDQKLRLRFILSAAAKPTIRQSDGRSELLVPILFTGKESKIVEEILW